MKQLFILIAFICFAVTLKAQKMTDTIQIEKKLVTTYSLYGEKITPRQMLNMMQVNPAAYDVMKKAKRNNDIGQVFGFAGGFLIGFPIGTAIAGGDPNWLLAGIGAGLVGVSIPFSIRYHKNAGAAVAMYNDGIRSLGYHELEMKLGFAANGIGLTLKF